VATIKLTAFADVTGAGLVAGLTSREPAPLRAFGWKDKISWQITLVEKNPDKGYAVPYVVVPTSGVTLKMGIGFFGETPLCQQATWSYNTPANTISGALDLATSDMAAKFASAGTLFIQPYLDLQLTDSAGTIALVHQQITVFRTLTLT
jgi:hypothetical protein